MKHTIYSFFFLCGLSLFLACSGDGAESIIRSLLMDYIETEDKIELEAEDQGTTISVDALKPWMITDIPEWLTIEPTSGYGKYEVHVNAKPNYTTESRSAILIVKSGDHQKEIQISQLGGIAPEIRNFDVREQTITTDGFQATFVATNVISCGICLSEGNSEPTTDDIVYTATPWEGNTWQTQVASLTSSTLYYIRAYAENQYGTVYSPTKAVQTTEHYLKVNPSVLNIKADGSQIELEVDCSDKWQVSDIRGTTNLFFEPSSGNLGRTQVRVWADANSTTHELKGSFTIRSEHSSMDVNVTQDAAEPSSSDHPLTIGSIETFTPEGGRQQVSVETKDKWSAELSPDVNWCTIVKAVDDKSLNISVTSNMSDDMSTADRSTQVKVKTDYMERTLNVQQKGRSLILMAEPQQLDFATAAGSKVVTVTATVSWSANSNQDWCIVQKNGNTSFSVSVTENTSNSRRSAAVTVKMADKLVVIPVTQEGTHSLTLSPSSFSFESNASTGKISVNTNGDIWQATSDQSWCTISPSSHNGSGTLDINVQENSTETERVATITIKTEYKTGTVRVTQTGVNSDLKVLPESISVTAEASEKELAINTENSWVATSSDASWCKLSDEQGSSSKNIKVSISANNTKEKRKATIVVKTAYKTIEIPVSQSEASHYLEVSPDNLSFNKSGGKKTLSISTKDAWSATIIDNGTSWCKVNGSNEMQGVGNAEIVVSAEVQTVAVRRSAQLIISTDYSSVFININQYPN